MKRKTTVHLVALCVAGMLIVSLMNILVVSASPEDNRWALIFGIETFDMSGGFGPAPYCPPEAIAFNDTLVTYYDWDPSHIMLLIDEEATREAIIDGIAWLKEHDGPNSKIVFWASSHGAYAGHKSERISYICPYGFSLWDMEEAIHDYELQEWFSDFVAPEIIFVLSTCYSGGMHPELDGSGMFNLCGDDFDSWWDYEDLSPYGTLYIVGYFVVKGLQDPAADTNDDGTVSMEEAFVYLEAGIDTRVGNNKNGKVPTPTLYDGISGETLLTL